MTNSWLSIVWRFAALSFRALPEPVPFPEKTGRCEQKAPVNRRTRLVTKRRIALAILGLPHGRSHSDINRLPQAYLDFVGSGQCLCSGARRHACPSLPMSRRPPLEFVGFPEPEAVGGPEIRQKPLPHKQAMNETALCG
jgi:hypothetical protein